MAHPRGVPGAALVFALVGAASITYAFWPAAPLRFHAFGVASASIALGTGVFLLFAATVWVVVRLTTRTAPPVAILADASFHTRMRHTLPPPEPPLSTVESRLAKDHVSPTAPVITELDAEIRELNKQVNKAAVLFATSQLSEDAYMRRVDSLKKKRAELESRKVQLGLGFNMR